MELLFVRKKRKTTKHRRRKPKGEKEKAIKEERRKEETEEKRKTNPSNRKTGLYPHRETYKRRIINNRKRMRQNVRFRRRP